MSIEIDGVWHRYGDTSGWVLQDVALQVKSGSITALVGPSGSGKTTLLTIAGRLLQPTRGRVTIDGVPVDLKDLGRFAWVFQTANALGHRTVLDNVALGLVSHGVTHEAARGRASQSLERVGLGSARYRLARELSGGELQRVNIARALISGPRILLADEPTAHLDRANADAVVRSLVELREPTTTVLLATHDPFVSACADRIVGIVNGRLVGI